MKSKEMYLFGLVIVLFLIIIAFFINSYLSKTKPTPSILINAWTDKTIYQIVRSDNSGFCPNGGSAGIISFVDITLPDGTDVKDAKVQKYTYKADGTILGELTDLSYDEKQGLWTGGDFFTCAQPGQYYNKITVSAVVDGKEVSADGSSLNFELM